MPDFTYSEQGLALTQRFEGLRLDAYQDVAGVWTIGYGHTGPEVRAGQKITELEAESLLRQDVAGAVGCVNRSVTTPLAQNQFDALVDFCFNVGCRNFTQSTLLKKLNAGDSAGAAEQFLMWVHAGGKRVPGLVRRREAERTMFLADGAVATQPGA